MNHKPAMQWRNQNEFRDSVKHYWFKKHPKSIGPSRDILRSCWDLCLDVQAEIRYVEAYETDAVKPLKDFTDKE